MAQQVPTTVRVTLNHTVQRPLENISAPLRADELWIEYPNEAGTATANVKVGWSQSDGTKPSTIDSSNQIFPVVPGGQRVIEQTTGSKHRKDFRHVCLLGVAGDDGQYVYLTYWTSANDYEPV